MIWPFAPDYRHRSAFLARNRVLVALADAVVVVQAGFPSGALRAASVARTLGKPLWVVPAPPWLDAFRGSRMLLDRGARPLLFVEAFLASLGLAATARPPEAVRLLEPSEVAALQGVLGSYRFTSTRSPHGLVSPHIPLPLRS